MTANGPVPDPKLLLSGHSAPIKLPPMPWYNVARLSDEDLSALFAYLKALPPVKNAVPGPIPPNNGK